MDTAGNEEKVAPEALISQFQVEKLLKQGSNAHPTAKDFYIFWVHTPRA